MPNEPDAHVRIASDAIDPNELAAYVTVTPPLVGARLALPVAAGVGGFLVWQGIGGAWTYLLPVLCFTVVFALMLATVRRRRVGIELRGTTVRLGSFPGQTHTFDASEVEALDTGSEPRSGPAEDVAGSPTSYLERGVESLDLTLRGGRRYRVAADATNPMVVEIVRRIRAIAGIAEPEPEPESEPAAEVGQPARSPQPLSRLWEAAAARHDEILLAYLPYETDPEILMQFPAMTDVSQPATADFLDALGDAAALRTDEFPHDEHLVTAYRASVRALGVAWASAERSAIRSGTSYLGTADQRRVDQALKLLRHARRATTGHERATYFQQVKAIIDQLARDGVLTAPPRVMAAIAGATRRAIAEADG